MKVILKENVVNLGEIGDIVNVANGYARNYLFPKQLAEFADERRIKQFNHQKAILEAKQKKALEAAKGEAGKLNGTKIEVTRKVGKSGKLFGSVTTIDIRKALEEKGFDVDRRQIALSEAIKSTGEFSFEVKVTRDVRAQLKLVVHGEETEEETPEAKVSEADAKAPEVESTDSSESGE